ncbi:sigma-70 family RNA polymerase sigma factor [Thalassobacillus hwangdonensis]|uniref:Sigma-70 family RNA polymerase sigma factor n=1 Tax=Thalassobacillus hwangdonensis TaxID=546108 RepID=A0ABW3L3X1_9BACI
MDVKLVKKAIKGDERAFEWLVREESDKLYRTAYLYVRNKDDALDIVQEAVCKAFLSIHQLKEPAYFSTWLTKILIRTAYDFIKKQKKIVLTGDDFLDQIAPSESVAKEDEMDLAHAIATLDYHYQTVIILFYYHDQSIQSISLTMDKPEGTIKTYLHRGKAELKRILEGVNVYG